ncbi:hypothetical protein [Rubripirellula obstinata]|nr:hypothetical protein [Rubripirellula obstinata]
MPSVSPAIFGNGRLHWYNLSQHKNKHFVRGGDVETFFHPTDPIE